MEGSEIRKSPESAQRSQQISLREFYMVLFVHKWTILGAFVIMLMAILWGLSLRQQLYIASVKFFVNRALPQQASLRYTGRLEWEEEINSIAELGRSQGVLVATARKFDQYRGYENPPESRVNEMAAGLATMVEVVPVQETNIINILVRDMDADTSIVIAGLYGEAFLDEFQRISKQSTGSGFFESALSDVENKILVAKESKAELQESTALYNWNHEQVSIAETVQYFSRDLTRRQLDRKLFQQQVETEEAYFDDPDNFAMTPSLRNDDLISKMQFEITELRLALSELRTRYTEDHRLVSAKERELDDAKLQLDSLIRSTISEHRQRLDQMILAESVLQQSIDEFNSRLEQIPTNAARLEYFDAFIDAQWRLYGELITKYTDTQATKEQSVIKNHIVQLGPPNIGGLEGMTPKIVYVVVAPLFAVLLAVAVAFMKEATTHTFQKPIELEEYTGIPVLASFRKL